MKMYLNIIRNNLEVRNYPTKKCVCLFCVDNEAGWKSIANKYNRAIMNSFDFLTHIANVCYMDARGNDCLTNNGLDIFKAASERKTPVFVDSEGFWC